MSRGRTPIKDTYSTHDVARICCVTPTTVIRWIEDGLIPAFKTVGGHRRVRREDLERVCGERGIPFTVPTGSEVGRILAEDLKGHEVSAFDLKLGDERGNALREHGYVLVTEGYMDVVALAQLVEPDIPG